MAWRGLGCGFISGSVILRNSVDGYHFQSAFVVDKGVV